MIKLQSEEQKALAHFIRSVSAIALDQSKTYLIEGRLAPLAEEIGCRTFSELLFRAQSDLGGTVRSRIIDAITTGETLFFRDAAPFDILRHKIIPEMIDRFAKSGRPPFIRIWSAACSTGQEIYSIAILLKEMLVDPGRYGVRLLATDISNRALARASCGIYNQTEIVRGLAESVRLKYFTPVKEGWKISDEIRAMVSFRNLNLMDDFLALGRFDVILCRNVAIYFSEQDRISLFARLERALEPDGCLIVGALESLENVCPQFESRRHMRSAYYIRRT